MNNKDFVITDTCKGQVLDVGNTKIKIQLFDNHYKDWGAITTIDKLEVTKTIKYTNNVDDYRIGDCLCYTIDDPKAGERVGIFGGNYMSDDNRFTLNQGWEWRTGFNNCELEVPLEFLQDPFAGIVSGTLVSFDYEKFDEDGESYWDYKRIIVTIASDKYVEGIYEDTNEYRKFSKEKIRSVQILEEPIIYKVQELLRTVAQWIDKVNNCGVMSFKNPNLYSEVIECIDLIEDRK